MFSNILVTSLLVLALVPAQRGGGSGSGAPPMDPTPKSAFEQFVEELKLDSKTQLPAVQQIFVQSAAEAGPTAQEIAQIRQRMLDAELAGKADEVKSAQDAYLTAAAKMTGFEAQAFAKVYALLKPNQKSKAADAFKLMGGLFQVVAPGGNRARRGGGR